MKLLTYLSVYSGRFTIISFFALGLFLLAFFIYSIIYSPFKYPIAEIIFYFCAPISIPVSFYIGVSLIRNKEWVISDYQRFRLKTINNKDK
jgi:hypothetical protein